MLTLTQPDLIVVKDLWKLSDLSSKTHAYLDYFDNPIAFFSAEKHSPARYHAIAVLWERPIEMISKWIVKNIYHALLFANEWSFWSTINIFFHYLFHHVFFNESFLKSSINVIGHLSDSLRSWEGQFSFFEEALFDISFCFIMWIVKYWNADKLNVRIKTIFTFLF